MKHEPLPTGPGDDDVPAALVFFQDGRPVTTSRIVAKALGRTHFHVLRGCDRLLTVAPHLLSGDPPAITASTFEVVQNRQAYRQFVLTQEGFDALALVIRGAAMFSIKPAFDSAFAAAGVQDVPARLPAANLPATTAPAQTTAVGGDVDDRLVFLRDGRPMVSSLDVADRFQKRHDHVLRDIDAMIAKAPHLADGLHPNFGEASIQTPGTTQARRIFVMDERAFFLLVASFTGARALAWKERFFDAFDRMRNELQTAPRLSTPPVTPAIEAQKEIADLRAALDEKEAEVRALDRLVAAKGSLNLTDAAKALDQPPHEFMRWLHSIGWIYRKSGARVGAWSPYQSRLQQGTLDVKLSTIVVNGQEKVAEQCRVTPKGLKLLAKKLEQARVAPL
jgi:Rha family phage regulatory protein